MTSASLKLWTRQSTWWSFVHLLCGVPLGYISSLFVVMALAIGAPALVLFPIAVVLSWVGLHVAHGMAQLERSRFAAFFDLDLADPAPRPTGTNLFNRYIARLKSPSTWREVLYLLLRLPVSAIEFALLVIVWGGSIALLALPFYVNQLPDWSVDVGLFSIGSFPPATIVGLVCLAFLAPWTTVALAQVDQAFGRSLLAWGSRTETEVEMDRLETRRVAAVDTAEAERRRIERDLHDGAQQRLIAAAMNLGVAKDRITTDPENASRLVGEAHEEVKEAMRELRDLVRGVHPVILEDRGLDAALSAVVARSTVPVDLRVDLPVRPPAAVESAAYFVVSEALVNIARHSRAAKASVDIRGDGRSLHIVISDDGLGGADPSGGTGLRGLADRVEALGGQFHIASPIGGPTRIEMEVPCAS